MYHEFKFNTLCITVATRYHPTQPTFFYFRTSGNISLNSTIEMVDDNPTVVSLEIENSASNNDPFHDLTAQIDTPMNTPSPISISETKKMTNRKNSDTPSIFQYSNRNF